MARLEDTYGFAPELIGRVVSVTLVPKNRQGQSFPESAQRFIGTLKAYYKNDKSESGSFIIDGYSPRQYSKGTDLITVYVLANEREVI